MIDGYDPLSDDLRWCNWCGADCWPEPENQQHLRDCPMLTGVYPITQDDVLPDGSHGVCTACKDPFRWDDSYAHVLADGPVGRALYEVCLGCHVLQRQPVAG